MSTLVESHLSPDLAALIRAHSKRRKVWLVGGALRDHFLEVKHPDLDFAVEDRAINLARDLADALEAPFYVLDEARDAARVILPDRSTLDLARLRAPTIEQDLELRDFSINALAVDLNDPGQLIDPLHGLPDLKNQLLRACAPDSIERDAIRSLRGVRLSVGLQLKLDEQTKQQIRDAKVELSNCPAERVRDELSRMLDQPWLSTAMRLMQRLGLLHVVLPELETLETSSWSHTLRTAERLAEMVGAIAGRFEVDGSGNLPLAELTLRLGRFRSGLGQHLETILRGGHTASQILDLATLYSNTQDAHNTVFARARKLRFSDAEAGHARAILRNWKRPLDYEADLSELGAHRFFRDSGSAGLEVVLLYLASSFAQSLPQEVWEQKVTAARTLLEAWFENHDRVVAPPRLVRGDKLASELNIEDGPVIGEMLVAIAERQVEGQIETAEQALEYARKWAK